MINREAGLSSSDGRGGESVPERPEGKPTHRYIYYRLYSKDGALESNNPIYSNDRSISRVLANYVAPPHTGGSIKRHLCRMEGFEGLGNGSLYASLSASTCLEDSARLSLRGNAGPGSSESEPMALVVETSAVEKRVAATAADEKALPERREEPGYVYYCIYDEGGRVSSKRSFNKNDPTLGRIEAFSIPPPQIVSSLKSCIVRFEEISSLDVQLVEDEYGETVLNDADAIALSSDRYPGIMEDEPMAIVYVSQKDRGTSKVQDSSPPLDPAFSKQIVRQASRGNWTSPDPAWHSFAAGEIFKTDGICRMEKYNEGPTTQTAYRCYVAINSAGKKAFVFCHAVDFC